MVIVLARMCITTVITITDRYYEHTSTGRGEAMEIHPVPTLYACCLLFKHIYVLAAPGLGCGTQDL